MGISPTESFIILYHEDMAAARAFYEDLLGLEVQLVVYEWFISYWVRAKHEMTLCIITSPDVSRQWGVNGNGVVVDFVVPDVGEAYHNLADRGIRFVKPPTDKPWRLRTASFLDTAGYTLTFTSYLWRKK